MVYGGGTRESLDGNPDCSWSNVRRHNLFVILTFQKTDGFLSQSSGEEGAMVCCFLCEQLSADYGAMYFGLCDSVCAGKRQGSDERAIFRDAGSCDRDFPAFVSYCVRSHCDWNAYNGKTSDGSVDDSILASMLSVYFCAEEHADGDGV